MGSSTSKTVSIQKQRKLIKSDLIDDDGFPRRGSIKSVSWGSEEFPDDESIKSLELSFPNKQAPSVQYLQSQLEDKEVEIRKIRSENSKLRAKVEELEKQVRQFSLQLDVATKQHLAPDHEITDGERNLPRIGDHVVAMWGSSKWQYFTATIQSFDKDTLKYTIEWDDKDPTGRIVDYFNLAVDKIPDEDQIGVGSKVLFHQATYKSSEVHGVTRSAGLRWHQGQIERVYNASDGRKLYEGRHTKGKADGKWITYKDYSEVFTDYTIEDFRMPPNVFDILSSAGSDQDGVDFGDIDVFVSYTKINSPSAISRNEINTSELPPTYEEAVLRDMCDPRDIVTQLKKMGVRVYSAENEDDSSLIETVNALKQAKVFVACLSDEYASNDRRRMEFQYAKKTLKLPVIPIVVGAGSFQWQLSVVGLLIAGELYINFKNKEVEGVKMTELARAIQNFIPSIQINNVQHPATGDAVLPLYNDPNQSVTGNMVKSGKADYFFSYCWRNSFQAFEQQQIGSYVGTNWSDPRLIQRKLSTSVNNLESWLDIERLQSASESLGMFGQIATAMNDCKFVIACVSSEYADSDNSRMEFQFATKSLKKPVIVALVGNDDLWKETAVGKLVEEENLSVINFQDLTSSDEMGVKISEIKETINKAMANTIEIAKFQAPTPGDHVVCLHQNWAYYLATVESFDPNTLEYTVNWDDQDPTGRVQSYENVALDVVSTDEPVVGSIVLFSQGTYGGTEGNNTGGSRYHQGKVSKVYKDKNGVTRFDGEHTKGEGDKKWVTYGGYSKFFTNKSIEELRVSPNPMDALMACKQAFSIQDQ